MVGVKSDYRNLVFFSVRAQVPSIVRLAIVVFVGFRSAAKLHQADRVLEEKPFLCGALASL